MSDMNKAGSVDDSGTRTTVRAASALLAIAVVFVGALGVVIYQQENSEVDHNNYTILLEAAAGCDLALEVLRTTTKTPLLRKDYPMVKKQVDRAKSQCIRGTISDAK